MKSFIILSFFILVSLTTIFGTEKQTKIEGQIIGYDGTKEVKYSISPFLSNIIADKSVKPDSLGRFTITISIENINFFWLYFKQNNISHRCQLILKPGCNYSFVSKGGVWDVDTQYTPEIVGCDNEGQMDFNLIDNGVRGPVSNSEWDLSHPQNVMDTLNERIETKKDKFKYLLKKKKIDTAFYNTAALNIEFFNAYKFAITINDFLGKNHSKIGEARIKELKSVYTKVFESYPIQGRRIENTLIFGDYIGLYLELNREFNPEEFQDYEKKGQELTYYLNAAKKILSDVAYQLYAIKNIANYSAKLDKEAQKLFEDFKNEYPNSIVKNTFYYKILESKYIPAIVELYKLSNKSFPSGIIILDNEKPINSFQEIVKHLEGKSFYVDCWATWCSPCRYDFQYNSPLKAFLMENHIEMVYIGFDKTVEREKWSNYIKSFDLKGYHLMSNSALISDLERVIGDSGFGLPRYIIVNSDGEIVERNAYRPSDGEKLYKQIKQKLMF